MSQSKTNSLFLYPKDVNWTIEPAKLVSALSSIELIENEIPDTQQCFFAGEQFINHITFLGCAPTIAFNATTDKPDFCFIRFISSETMQMIQTNKLVRAPHCPHCKKSVPQWEDFSHANPWLCPHCAQSANAHEYSWKRTAGFARVFIEITDIYPKEAIPQPSLLEKLASLTDVQWDYFYYCA